MIRYIDGAEADSHPASQDGEVAEQTAWNRVLLGKLTVTKLVKKFPAFYGTGRFITVFTTAHHWSLS
jgi:hypothetical protein